LLRLARLLLGVVASVVVVAVFDDGHAVVNQQLWPMQVNALRLVMATALRVVFEGHRCQLCAEQMVAVMRLRAWIFVVQRSSSSWGMLEPVWNHSVSSCLSLSLLPA
jgi:hypothetical protein